jgi:GNAT superfamily N-acetyltransferase
MAHNHDRIEITTDLARIDLDRVHAWIAQKPHWRGRMPRIVFEQAVRGSLCFGALERGATIGFCRVISDRATFAYLCDMFVAPARRGSGIGKAILALIMDHPELKAVHLWLLATADAHGLYARHGFCVLGAPWRYMERRDAEVYQRIAEER